MPETRPKASYVVSKCFVTELEPQSLLSFKTEDSKMARWLKMLAAELSYLSWILGIHIVERESQFLPAVLNLHIYTMYKYTHLQGIINIMAFETGS